MTEAIREVRKVNNPYRWPTYSVWENGDWWRTANGRRRAWSWRDRAQQAMEREVDESVGEMVRLMSRGGSRGPRND